MTRVAVIIINYNAGDLLLECLAALAQQTVQPARVLVMDNGSVDQSADRCRTAFPWVELHRLNANLGFARANNLAVGLVPDCEWLALLNPDAFPEPQWLESLLDGAGQYPDTDVFASCMLTTDQPALIDGAGDSYRIDGVAWSRLQGEPVARVPGDASDVFAPSAGAGFYRRRAFVAAGCFSERYFCYYEDVDLGFRLRLSGYRCRFLPRAVVRHVGSAVTGKGSDFSVYHVHRNMIWTYFKNMPGIYLWIFLPAHLMANLVSIAVFLAQGRRRVIWQAKWDALKVLPEIMRERRDIQAKRRVPARAVLRYMERGGIFRTVFRRVSAWVRRVAS